MGRLLIRLGLRKAPPPPPQLAYRLGAGAEGLAMRAAAYAVLAAVAAARGGAVPD